MYIIHPIPAPQVSVTDCVFADNTATDPRYAGGALSIFGSPSFTTTVSNSMFLGNNAVISTAVCIGKYGTNAGPKKAKITGCTGLVLPSKPPDPTAGDCNVAALQQSP